MIKAFKDLKPIYKGLRHVTCIAHALHRVAELYRDTHKEVNGLVSAMKMALKKSPKRKSLYYETTGLTFLPSDPILTRWGS